MTTAPSWFTGANTGMGRNHHRDVHQARPSPSTVLPATPERLERGGPGRTGMTPLTVDVHRHRSIDRSCGRPRDRHPGQQRGGCRRPAISLARSRRLGRRPWSTSISGPSCTCCRPAAAGDDRGATLGHIVNISSIAGLYNFYGHTAYSRDKGLRFHQLSRQLRNDTIGKRVSGHRDLPGPRSKTEIFGPKPRRQPPKAMQTAWDTYYEGFESITNQGHRRHHRVRHRSSTPCEPRPDRDHADIFRYQAGLDFIRRND